MTDSNTALSEVPALLEERRRYESWLAALDARRESTPEHVFQRVQSDYRGRLQRVAELLASHRHAIEEERTNVASRRSLLEAEERMRRDERAELELRAHVGELVEADAVSAFGAVDGAIEHLVTEKSALAARIAELDEMLIDRPLPSDSAAQSTESPPAELSPEHQPAPDDDRSPPPAAAHAENGADRTAVPASFARRPLTPSGTFDEMAFLDALVGSEDGDAKPGSSPGAAGTGATGTGPAGTGAAGIEATGVGAGSAGVSSTTASGPSAAASSSAPSAPAARPSAPFAVPMPDQPAQSRASAAHAEPAASAQLPEHRASGSAASQLPDSASPPPPAAPAATQAAVSQPAPVAQRASQAVPVQSSESDAGDSATEPLAMNVTGNRPIVLRTTITTEMSKTLKCNECGAMNYPTEWYCERCGAELAAL